MYNPPSNPRNKNFVDRDLEKRLARDVDNIYNQLKYVRGEIYQLRSGNAEDEKYKKLIKDETIAQLYFVDGEMMKNVRITENYRHCFTAQKDSNTFIVQKSNLKYLVY